MRSQAHGLMTTLLMFVPLLAVPFLAGFGVPWLAAKSQSESLERDYEYEMDLSDVPTPPMPDSEVGQSQTAEHSVDQLFAPVLEPPAVDLQNAAPPTETSVPNLHLRNASLAVNPEDPWSDPFENGNPPAMRETAPARQAVNPTSSNPQKALEDWVVKDELEEEPTAEAPLPRAGEFERSPNTEVASATNNPFADFQPPDADSAEPADSQVRIQENAFEDPPPKPQVNRDPAQFDASRTLFSSGNQNTTDQTAPPDTPMQTAESTPPAVPSNDPPAASSNDAPADSVSHQPATKTNDTEPLDYQTARARLQELGIERYYLTPDPERKVFHFRCAYTPPDNPRISHRFEAEASEPLEAVRKVLTQVESWTARQ